MSQFVVYSNIKKKQNLHTFIVPFWFIPALRFFPMGRPSATEVALTSNATPSPSQRHHPGCIHPWAPYKKPTLMVRCSIYLTLLLIAEIQHQLIASFSDVGPIICRVSYIPGGAGFQPSTVVSLVCPQGACLTRLIKMPYHNIITLTIEPLLGLVLLRGGHLFSKPWEAGGIHVVNLNLRAFCQHGLWKDTDLNIQTMFGDVWGISHSMCLPPFNP